MTLFMFLTRKNNASNLQLVRQYPQYREPHCRRQRRRKVVRKLLQDSAAQQHESEADWAESADARHLRVQFERLNQRLAGMPGATQISPSLESTILGISTTEIAAIRRELSSNVDEAVRELEQDSSIKQLIEAAKVRWTGKTILCLGDSITADWQSWAQIIAKSLEPAVLVVNAGRSGDTTGDLVSRFNAAVAPFDPDGVIVLAGTNDGRRYAAEPLATSGLSAEATSDTETEKNYLVLEELIVKRGAVGMWITPPPVIDSRIATHPGIRAAHARWSNEASARKASIVRSLFGGGQFAEDGFHSVDDPSELMLADGLHPNLRGQLTIAKQALRLLAAPVLPPASTIEVGDSR
jgi:lysophospholipase L1-like esterase